MVTRPGDLATAGPDGIGERLRGERTRAGLSQRELARRLGLSASLISQLESGVSNPSVGTLYAIVTELDVSIDRLIRGHEFESDEPGVAPPPPGRSVVVRAGEGATIVLDSGVVWQDLTACSDDAVDFLRMTYEVGGSSSPEGSMMRHLGREYGHVISGRLAIQVGFEEFDLGTGDAIAFDSTVPHRLVNSGDVPVEAVWFVVGWVGDQPLVH